MSSANEFPCPTCEGRGNTSYHDPDLGRDVVHICLVCGGSRRMCDRHLMEEIARNLRRLLAAQEGK